MRIEKYFAALAATIDGCSWVRTSTITYDQRSTYEGYVRGEIYFVDDSMLHLREFVDCEADMNRLVYA